MLVHKIRLNAINSNNISIHSVFISLIERCISICKMTTKRYGQQQHRQQPSATATATATKTFNQFIHSTNIVSIKTWIVQSIVSSNATSKSKSNRIDGNSSQRNSKSSRIGKRRRRRKSENRSRDRSYSNKNLTHDNYNVDSYGSNLSKFKYQTAFKRQFKLILIVVLVSFTFADMVYGKWALFFISYIMNEIAIQAKKNSNWKGDSQKRLHSLLLPFSTIKNVHSQKPKMKSTLGFYLIKFREIHIHIHYFCIVFELYYSIFDVRLTWLLAFSQLLGAIKRKTFEVNRSEGTFPLGLTQYQLIDLHTFLLPASQFL